MFFSFLRFFVFGKIDVALLFVAVIIFILSLYDNFLDFFGFELLDFLDSFIHSRLKFVPSDSFEPCNRDSQFMLCFLFSSRPLMQSDMQELLCDQWCGIFLRCLVRADVLCFFNLGLIVPWLTAA